MGEVIGSSHFSTPEPITSAHDLTRFESGKPVLDEWLKSRALASEGPSARTYVVHSDRIVIAYYCLAAGGVTHSELPGKLKRNMPNPVPMMLLGRLAVDRRHQRQGIGGGLMKDALIRVAEANKLVGFRALFVHAIDDEALAFYSGYGFHEYPRASRTLFLPIEMVMAGL